MKTGWAFVFISFLIVGVFGILFSFFTAIYFESYRTTLQIEATIFTRDDEESKFYKSNRKKYMNTCRLLAMDQKNMQHF